MSRKHIGVLLVGLVLSLAISGVALAQYNPPSSISVTFNNINRPVRRNGLVVIGQSQPALPVVAVMPPGQLSAVRLSFEGTGFAWFVKVDPDGRFLTNFPVNMFPPGTYWMTVNGVRVQRIVIPPTYRP